ncbi:YdeI family protein [Zeaxanthinibacter enoshimensis]|uniref:YdeI/OmpD-associated family protein n=1 Tax=Zeaxanthinibacter enoshimensis TaxID=392009 RepID=UPI003566BDAF
MDHSEKVEAYYEKEQPFKEALGILRELAIKSGAGETLKWGSPVYTVQGKNIFGIMAFKEHFGIWFFNGVYLKDPLGVLHTGQEKTKAMRHWKFNSTEDIDQNAVLAYMKEAVKNQEKGLEWKPERTEHTIIPALLKNALESDPVLKESFGKLSPYKQREFCEHIETAKQDKTKQRRLEKSLPMIRKGVGLHDKYRP